MPSPVEMLKNYIEYKGYKNGAPLAVVSKDAKFLLHVTSTQLALVASQLQEKLEAGPAVASAQPKLMTRAYSRLTAKRADPSAQETAISSAPASAEAEASSPAPQLHITPEQEKEDKEKLAQALQDHPAAGHKPRGMG